jgi:hypothetical protein
MGGLSTASLLAGRQGEKKCSGPRDVVIHSNKKMKVSLAYREGTCNKGEIQ